MGRAAPGIGGRVKNVVDMDDPRIRAAMMNRIKDMRGRWRFDVCRYRPRRSDRQNRYYWPCFVQPFAQYLMEQGHEGVNEDIAHEFLKARYLKRPIVNKATGELMGEYVESTTELDTGEFNEYLDNCAQFLAERCEIVVPDPSDYHEREEA